MQHPLLHRHHLCCGSDPQRLSCLHRHHWGFLMALPADAHSTDDWRLVLNPESSSASSLYHHPWNHSGPSLLWAGVSVQLRKTAYKDLCNLAPDYFYSHFFLPYPHVPFSPKYCLFLTQLNVSHTWTPVGLGFLSFRLSISLTPPRLSYAKNLLGALLSWTGGGLLLWLLCRVFNGALIFFLLVQGSIVQYNVLWPLCLI